MVNIKYASARTRLIISRERLTDTLVLVSVACGAGDSSLEVGDEVSRHSGGRASLRSSPSRIHM